MKFCIEPSAPNRRGLAHALGVPATRGSKIIATEYGITAGTALRLGRYFGTSAETWLNMQAGYDLRRARYESEKAINRGVQPMRQGAA